MHDVTLILQEVEKRTLTPSSVSADLLPLVYNELRRLARLRLAKENPGQTLQATDLVHEAFVRLVDSSVAQNWDSRGHFFAAAAESMRRILVDRARAKNRLKRGAGLTRQELDEAEIAAPIASDRIIAVHEALEEFEATSPQAAQLVKLRYFAGLTIAEASQTLQISPRKANQVWNYARAWMIAELGDLSFDNVE
jgi:RNA polymerase sigma factor (TIGR02999 family)